MLLATWNIKDFDSRRRRRPESRFHIAEILSAFDLVAIQEVGDDLTDLREVMKVLGDSWAYFAAETAGLTRQRLVFLYARRKVRFQSGAGQVVLSKRDAHPGRFVAGTFSEPPRPYTLGSRLVRIQLVRSFCCTVAQKLAGPVPDRAASRRRGCARRSGATRSTGRL